MKKCSDCDFSTEDDKIGFCPYCGTTLNLGVNPSEDSVDLSDVNSDDASHKDYGSNGVSLQIDIDMPGESENDIPKKKKKKILLWILIPILSVILVAGGLLVYFIFFAKGPVVDIMLAAMNTVEAESFTFEVEVDDERYDGAVELDFEKKDIYLLIESYDSDFVIGVYDGQLFQIKTNSSGIRYYYCSDYSDQIAALFDAWDIAKDSFTSSEIDWDVFFEFLDDLFENMDKDEIRDKVEDFVDLEKMSIAFREAIKLLNDDEWLDECTDCEKTKRNGVVKYSFDLDFYEIGETVEYLLEDCSNSKMVDNIIDSIVEELKDMDEEDVSVEIDVSIKDGYISVISVNAGGNGWSDRFELEINDVGSIQLDRGDLQDYLDECEEYSGGYVIPNIPDGGIVW